MSKELFKYRKFNEFSLESISEDVIWVSKPDKLNDPFEYSFHIDPDMPFHEVIKRTKGVTKENYIEKQKRLISAVKKDFEIGGIFSLSEERNISLMWSHYADSHKGFCIGYKVSAENDLGNGNCQKINYGKFPEISFNNLWIAFETGNPQVIERKLFEIMVLAKDKNWKYESEWRVLYKQSNMLIKANFPISSITFGMFMSGSQKNIIKKLLHDRDVSFFEAHKPKKSYNVDIKNHA